MEYHIKKIDKSNRQKVLEIIVQEWYSTKVVAKGKIYDTKLLHGFVVEHRNKILGIITCHIQMDKYQICTLNSLDENKSIGTSLVNRAVKDAKAKKCTCVWLITTNDNINAIRFYQKRGFELKALHNNAIEKSRKLKPEIPLTGFYDIPIVHELEFERKI